MAQVPKIRFTPFVFSVEMPKKKKLAKRTNITEKEDGLLLSRVNEWIRETWIPHSNSLLDF